MARRSNQKLKLLYLSRILIEQTDESRGLTLAEIVDELSKYGIEAGRKSLYDDMEALRVYGLNVKVKRDRYVRYYVTDGRFERAELRIIADLVASSGILTAQKTDTIIKKLKELGLSSNENFDSPFSKQITEDAYNNIGLICKAISLDKRLTFKCFEWNSRKQRILRSGGEYFSVSPYKLIFNEGKYLLVAYDHNKKAADVFAPEKLIDVSVSGRKRDLSAMNYSLEDCIEERINVQLKCDNSVAGNVFEKFGTDVTVLSNRENSFEVSAKVLANDAFFAWLFAMNGSIKVLNPAWVVERYEEMLLNNIKVLRNEKV